MSEDHAPLTTYVDATARLTRMPLTPERVRNVVMVMARIADFAADLGTFTLTDDVEIAGTFTP